MASATDAALNGNVINQTAGMQFSRALTQKITLALAIAAVIAVMTGFWLWSQKPEYRVLFSNFNDKDGGAIVAALEQMNVPYQFSAGGSAILVPDEHVHQSRLKIASLGLPKGGNVGFELLENQKFGVSQFVEQVNFQRALEGELEKSIQAVSAVQNARVHLAIPKSTVFVRDQQKPTASVLVNLHPGRTLDPQQVSAVVHLVASSVPDLPTANVTIVDQNGNLLSDTSKKANQNQLDPTQLKYVDDMQLGIVKRVESIILPIVGAQNVHAEATVDIDFSSLEQADEIYKPNQTPEAIVIRSQQSNESNSSTTTEATGVPGALSNQPPPNATAPIIANNANANQTTTNAPVTTPVSTEKNVTTNYEVDKTIRYSQQAMGGVKRITVAVVVNHKRVLDAKGAVSYVPLSDDEKTQITELAKEAMGFNKDRGDSLSVVNSSFADTPQEVLPEIPVWQNPDNINMAKELLKTLLALAVLFLLYKRLLKPMMTKLVVAQPNLLTNQVGMAAESEAAVVQLSNQPNIIASKSQQGYQQSLESAKLMAKDNPKMVANVVTAWVSGNE